MDATRNSMLSYGVVDAMVTLLHRSQHAPTLEQAAACLSNLMLNSDAGRLAVGELLATSVRGLKQVIDAQL